MLTEYFRLNKLSLNISKSSLLHFHSSRKKLPYVQDISIHGNLIQTVTSVRYLGIILDSHLSWKPHITSICKKLSPSIGILSKLKYYLPSRILKMLYFSMIHSRISYLVGVWGGVCDSVLRPLRILQKRALKYVRRVNCRFPSRDLFTCQDFRVLTLNNLYKLAVGKFVHNCVRNLSFHTLTFESAPHTYDTRHRSRLRRPLFRRGFASSAVSYTDPAVYDTIPNEIRSMESPDLFLKQFKSWLFESQSTDSGH